MKNKAFTPHLLWGKKEKLIGLAPSKKGAGFTILELIMAIFVMTVGVLGAYAVVQQIIVYTLVSSSRLTAAYLAQEGIEIVRNIRDTNWLTVPPVVWNEGVSSSQEIVGFLDGTTSKFNRNITITPDGSDKLKVSVLIEWTEKGKNYTVTVEEDLYNWY